jgi:putative transposase
MADIPDAVVDSLFAQVDSAADILAPDGLIPQLVKKVLERALATELTEHLGYEKHDAAGRCSGNSRNGTTPKTLLTDVGPVDLDVPRDRAGTFEPQVVAKNQTRLEGFNERIISLYARGLTVRDVKAHLEEIYGAEVSPDLISKVTDAVMAELKEWQSRPLDRVYPVMFLDALVAKVRHEGVVINKAAHLAVGVDTDGKKQVLGIWIETNEGAKFWLRVMNELRNRGVEDVLIVCCDGLKGLPEAIETVWPKAWVQTCIVHLMRNSLAFVGYQDRKRVAAALKDIYRAESEEAAAEALGVFDAAWGARYPGITKMWRDNWERIVPFLVFPPEIRKVIYTTNSIESINYQLRKVIKNRGHFPTDDALIKLLYLAIRNIEKKGGTGTYSWKLALNQFTIFFPNRLDIPA